jgi:Ni/Co efflux regulator RcnB
MKKLVLTALALSVLSTPALAQKGNKDSEPLAILEREKKQQAEHLDQQYNRQMERSRKEGSTAATRSDPWANMRAPNDGKR